MIYISIIEINIHFVTSRFHIILMCILLLLTNLAVRYVSFTYCCYMQKQLHTCCYSLINNDTGHLQLHISHLYR